MAFDKAGLNLAAGSKNGNAPKIWTYKTTDACATVDGAGYFDNGSTTNTGMRNLMAVGDFIFVHATSDTTPTGSIVMVNSNSSGIIDTSNAAAAGGGAGTGNFGIDSD